MVNPNIDELISLPNQAQRTSFSLANIAAQM